MAFGLALVAGAAAKAQGSRAASLQQFDASIEALADKVSPSVVQILVAAYAAVEQGGAGGAMVVERWWGSVGGSVGGGGWRGAWGEAWGEAWEGGWRGAWGGAWRGGAAAQRDWWWAGSAPSAPV